MTCGRREAQESGGDGTSSRRHTHMVTVNGGKNQAKSGWEEGVGKTSMWVSTQADHNKLLRKEERGQTPVRSSACSRDRQTQCLLCAGNKTRHQGKCKSQHTDPLTAPSEIEKAEKALWHKGDTKETLVRRLRGGCGTPCDTPDKRSFIERMTLLSQKQGRNKGAWEKEIKDA